VILTIFQKDTAKNTAYLSLGSNMNNPCAQLKEAIERLKKLGIVVQVSSFYKTEPLELKEQSWFINCSLRFNTNLDPKSLMYACLRIEQEMGRRRTERKGPRAIDIDLLLFNNEVMDEPDLQLPHPAMQHRRFVLAPLAEIAPDAWHPGLHKTALELLQALGEGGGIVQKLDFCVENSGEP